ncbi:phospholipid phosphatase 1-like [Oppia nitens]|uniref:phospholipid phosphatase 1-like n=1 Tax=Oppia nitens TaxID=1686743 RepID=UPI0023DC9A50|nr:phospholipid phosphatase 1-like [Oppia nitens]
MSQLMYCLHHLMEVKLMRSSRTKKICIDSLCFTIILFLWLLIKCLCQPYRRGYWCDDHTIRYPHKELVITTSATGAGGSSGGGGFAAIFLLIWSFVLPAVAIIVFESIRVRKMYVFIDKTSHQFDWRYLSWKLYKKLSVFYLGALVLVLITTVIKYTTGRLRPDFIDLCRPDYDCRGSNGSGKEDSRTAIYVDNYTCANSYRLYDQIQEARMSFLSGHSAYSAYCAVYFCIYLHQKMRSQLLVALKAVLQLMSVLASLYIGLNRIVVNRHHPSDVWSGLLLGTGMACLVNRYYLNSRRMGYTTDTDTDTDDTRGSVDLIQASNSYYDSNLSDKT